QHQMQWVGGRWNKAKAGVECRGLGILRMYQYGANSDCVGGVEASDQGVFKQALADSFSLLSMIHRKPRQQHHRNGVTRHAFANALGRGGFFDGTSAKRIVTNYNNRLFRAANISAGASGRVVGKGKAVQIVVQRRRAAVERLNIVLNGQEFRRAEHHRMSKTDFSLSNRFSAGISRGGESKSS